MTGHDPGDALPFIDTTVPNVARIYDYLLGGKDNYAADRAAAEEIARLIPGSARAARQNRAFMRRVVHYLAGQAGIRQFIDLGSGLPTMDNVHQVARRAAPGARVVYADFDPVVIAHANALMADDNVAIVKADLRNPDDILGHPQVRKLVDFSQPAAVLMIAILHFIADSSRPLWITEQFMRRLAPGSYLALSHVTDDDVPAGQNKAAQEVYGGATAPVIPRPHGEIMRFFGGMTLLEPGLVDIGAWPSPSPGYKPGRPRLIYGGIARAEGRQANG
jgi:hypothetical protein